MTLRIFYSFMRLCFLVLFAVCVVGAVVVPDLWGKAGMVVLGVCCLVGVRECRP